MTKNNTTSFARSNNCMHQQKNVHLVGVNYNNISYYRHKKPFQTFTLMLFNRPLYSAHPLSVTFSWPAPFFLPGPKVLFPMQLKCCLHEECQKGFSQTALSPSVLSGQDYLQPCTLKADAFSALCPQGRKIFSPGPSGQRFN